MDESTLQSLGFTWPTPAYFLGMLLFSIVGYGAFRYGRKAGRYPTMWIGIVLMLYPYVVSRTWLLYVVGLVLCAGIWIDHR